MKLSERIKRAEERISVNPGKDYEIVIDGNGSGKGCKFFELLPGGIRKEVPRPSEIQFDGKAEINFI